MKTSKSQVAVSISHIYQSLWQFSISSAKILASIKRAVPYPSAIHYFLLQGVYFTFILGTQRSDIHRQCLCLVLKHCRATFKGESIIMLQLKDASSRPSFWFVIFPGYVSNHVYLGFLTHLQKAVKINCL